jgi:hypothetical protein
MTDLSNVPVCHFFHNWTKLELYKKNTIQFWDDDMKYVEYRKVYHKYTRKCITCGLEQYKEVKV